MNEKKNHYTYYIDFWKVGNYWWRRNKWFLKSLDYSKAMLLYCLKREKKAETKSPYIIKTNKGKILLSSKCEVCEKTPLSKMQLLGDVFL